MMVRTSFIFPFLLASLWTTEAEFFYTRLLHTKANECTILEEYASAKVFKGFQNQGENELVVTHRPSFQPPGDDPTVKIPHSFRYEGLGTEVLEIWGKKLSVISSYVNLLCKGGIEPISPPAALRNLPEIRKIVDGGDPKNRIDVVFMGDGYTSNERDQFFDDMERLTHDMFRGVTFRSYLPVFNIWAVFVPSEESGIGYNGPKNTTFSLYREQGQLRAIFPGNAPLARKVCSMVGPSSCDYPSLIANDDYYGGLGGEFVISTKSAKTGTMVLRHEMGHNFVDVGEEYDNGWVYTGVNSSPTLSNLKWKHWLSGNTTNKGPLREEKVIFRLLRHTWVDLNKGEQGYHFYSDGNFDGWYLIVSVSAAGEENCLEFKMDGKILPWQTRGSDDREFYDWYGKNGLSRGWHNITVRSKTKSKNKDIPRMLCNIQFHENGNQEEFHDDLNYIGAFPTFDVYRNKTYRPTNGGCLMRNMTHPQFCNVCKEGMWHQFLTRISLIDSVSVDEKTKAKNGLTTVVLNTIQLGQLRSAEHRVEGEKLNVKWFKNGVEQKEYRDLFKIEATPGKWTVDVQFVTLEVRSDPRGLLHDIEKFTIKA